MQFSDWTELCGGGAQCNCSPGVGVTICADERTPARLKSKVWIPFYQSISLLFVPSRTYSTHLESEISGQNSDPSSSAERSVSGWYTYSAVLEVHRPTPWQFGQTEPCRCFAPHSLCTVPPLSSCWRRRNRCCRWRQSFKRRAGGTDPWPGWQVLIRVMACDELKNESIWKIWIGFGPLLPFATFGFEDDSESFVTI